MNKQKVVDLILGSGRRMETVIAGASQYAPANIALCKYWGKRNAELNLPLTSSLSLSLGKLGSQTKIERTSKADEYFLNGEPVSPGTEFAKRQAAFLDLFRPAPDFCFKVQSINTVPTAAGVASSASGFAALVLALNELFGWTLSKEKLSVLARLGSGSACRSLYQGFVEWNRGEMDDGSDCFARPMDAKWPELRMALIRVFEGRKPVSSRAAMERTVRTSELYKCWPLRVEEDMKSLKGAIAERDFGALGETAEQNALTMHATMMGAKPSVLYFQPGTVEVMQSVWELRKAGTGIYFTIDAGPNVKLLFLDGVNVNDYFPDAKLVNPWEA